MWQHDPELPRQQKEHQAFVNKVNTYRLADITDESARELILELLKYLSKWLMGHILGSDILIGKFDSDDKPTIPVFTEKFKTGIPMIDEEHKTLFDIISSAAYPCDGFRAFDGIYSDMVSAYTV